MRQVCPGALLGFLIWFGLALGVYDAVAGSWFYLTLSPHCPDAARPFVMVGLFTTEIASTCLASDTQIPQGNSSNITELEPDRVALPTVFDDLQPMKIASAEAFGSKSAWDLSNGALLGRSAEIASASPSRCQVLWTHDIASAMLRDPRPSQAVDSLEHLLKKEYELYQSQLLKNMQDIYTGNLIRILWMYVMHISRVTLKGLLTIIDGSPPIGEEDVRGQLAYVVLRSAKLTKLASEGVVCKQHYDPVACSVAIKQIQDYTKQLYFNIAIQFTFTVTSSVSDQEIFRLAMETTDHNFLTSYIECVSALSLATISKVTPLQNTVYASSRDHPLCLAFRSASLLQTHKQASDKCPLAAVLFSIQKGYAYPISDFIDEKLDEVVHLFDSNFNGEPSSWCTTPERWKFSSAKDNKSLENSRCDSAECDVSPDDIALIANRVFIGSLCGAQRYFQSEASFVESFLFHENCEGTLSFEECIDAFIGNLSESKWPHSLDDPFPLCHKFTYDEIRDLVGFTGSTCQRGSNPLESQRLCMNSMRSSCTLRHYLVSMSGESDANILLLRIIEPCEELQYFNKTACVSLENSMDIASAYYGSDIRSLDDLKNECSDQLEMKNQHDPKFAFSQAFWIFGSFLSFLGCIMLVCTVFRKTRLSLMMTSFVVVLAAIFKTLALVFLTQTRLMQLAIVNTEQSTVLGAAPPSNSFLEGLNAECIDNQLCLSFGPAHTFAIVSCVATALCGLALFILLCFCGTPDSVPFKEHRNSELHKRFAYAPADATSMLIPTSEGSHCSFNDDTRTEIDIMFGDNNSDGNSDAFYSPRSRRRLLDVHFPSLTSSNAYSRLPISHTSSADTRDPRLSTFSSSSSRDSCDSANSGSQGLLTVL